MGFFSKLFNLESEDERKKRREAKIERSLRLQESFEEFSIALTEDLKEKAEKQEKAEKERKEKARKKEEAIQNFINNPHSLDSLDEGEIDYLEIQTRSDLQVLEESSQKHKKCLEEKPEGLLADLFSEPVQASYAEITNDIITHKLLLELIQAKRKRGINKKPREKSEKQKVNVQLGEIQAEIDRLNGEMERKLKNSNDEDDELRIRNRYANLIHQLEEEAIELRQKSRNV